MWLWLGWILAWLFFGAGLLMALVPGLSGSLLALLGVLLFALCIPAQLSVGTIPLAAAIALSSCLAQSLAPTWGLRGASRATGAATGALLGGVMLFWTPFPLIALLFAMLGAVIGLPFGSGGLIARLRTPFAILPTLLLTVLVDVVGVLSIAAVLGLSTVLVTL